LRPITGTKSGEKYMTALDIFQYSLIAGVVIVGIAGIVIVVRSED